MADHHAVLIHNSVITTASMHGLGGPPITYADEVFGRRNLAARPTSNRSTLPS
jgi:hypothetical protein